MAARSRSRAGTCSGRTIGHKAEFLGTGRIFPGRASLATTCIGRHPGFGFDSSGHKPCWQRQSFRQRSQISNMGCSVLSKHNSLFQQLGDQRGEIDARLRYIHLAVLAGIDTNKQAQVEEALRMAEQISYKAGIARAKLDAGNNCL